jgi:hypothetical protein
LVNITVTTVGDQVTITTSLDNTTAAAQFLAGPTGAAGAASYRAIAGGDLPTATTGAKGGVIVNGSGLTMSGDTVQIDNTVTANSSTYQVVQFSSKGLVTDGRDITGADLPAATAGAIGGVVPGSGLSVAAGGTLNHTNSATPGSYPKVTIDAQGHVSAGSALSSTDIPSLDASIITTGEFATARIANTAITGAKLANYAVSKFGETQPLADHVGQFFFNPLDRTLYLWDSNVWQPIGVSFGELIFTGTYNASTNLVASVTAEGTAIGLTVGSPLPAANSANSRHYLVVSTAGTGTAPAPAVSLSPPDLVLSDGSAWTEIDVSQTVTSQIATNVSFTPSGNVSATNVQAAIQELDGEKLPLAGGIISGELTIGSTGALAFEGSTDNAFETYLAVVDPTADRTITFPNASGNIVLSGSIANADINASAAIAFSKLASLTSANILVGNGSNVATSVAVTGDVTISNAGVTAIATGVVVDADISGSAAIALSKLATGALPTDITVASANIVDATIVNADISATAAIAFSKLANVSATDRLLGRSTAGAGAIEEVTCTAAGRALIDDADAAAQRTTLGLAIGTDVQAYDADTAKTDVVQAFTAAQRGAITTLTDAATIAVDFADSNNFSVTLGDNRTLGNPTNQVAGQSGSLFVVQDGTGSRTLAYSSDWEFSGGTAPTLSTAASAVDRIDYIVRASGNIHAVFTAAYS